MITLDPNTDNTIQFLTCDAVDGDLVVIKAYPEVGPCATTTKPVNVVVVCGSANVTFHPVDDLTMREGVYKLEIWNPDETIRLFRSRVEITAFCDEVVPVVPDFCDAFVAGLSARQIACISVDATTGGDASSDYSLVPFITSGGDVAS